MDKVFPTYMRLATVESPVALLKEAIRCISARQMTEDRGAWNQAGPAENIFHYKAYATLRKLIPRKWTCTNEVRATKATTETGLTC